MDVIIELIYDIHIGYAEEADKVGNTEEATIQRKLADFCKNNDVEGYNQFCKENNINAKINLL
jgi:hypothetical protein